MARMKGRDAAIDAGWRTNIPALAAGITVEQVKHEQFPPR